MMLLLLGAVVVADTFVSLTVSFPAWVPVSEVVVVIDDRLPGLYYLHVQKDEERLPKTVVQRQLRQARSQMAGRAYLASRVCSDDDDVWEVVVVAAAAAACFLGCLEAY